MSNTKHTPGPWHISSASKNAINAERNNKLIGIGTTYHDPDSVYFVGQDEAIANARLISAAPDMLQALLVLRSYFEGNGQIPNALAPAIAAIAKATAQ